MKSWNPKNILHSTFTIYNIIKIKIKFKHLKFLIAIQSLDETFFPSFTHSNFNLPKHTKRYTTKQDINKYLK